MTRHQPLFIALILSVVLVLSACNMGDTRQPAPTAAENTAAPTWTPLPTRTPIAPVTVALTSRPGVTSLPPTPIFPPTATRDPNIPILLQNGRGISNGQRVTDGNFQVEQYCKQLNPNYNISEDGRDWYCTENGQRVKDLTKSDFDAICRQTYDNPTAFALQIDNGQPAAYRWRCYGFPQ
jgi:hypothetical protein